MKTTDFLTELSNDKLAQYKTAAAADASKADREGNFKKGDKRFKGINTATKKQFANDEKKVEEGINLSPDQIQQMFQGAQNIETAGGTNRSMVGKAKDRYTNSYNTRRNRYQPPKPPPETLRVAGGRAETQPMATPNPGAVWKSNRNPALPAQTSPTRLSESQIHQLIEAIVKHQSQVDEGVMDWAKTKGQNLTTKVTADKLLQAWKSAGSNPDSDYVADVMTKAGVPQETLNNIYKNFKIPAPKPVPAGPGLVSRMASGIGSAIAAPKGAWTGVKDAYTSGKSSGFDAARGATAGQHTGYTGAVNPYTRTQPGTQNQQGAEQPAGAQQGTNQQSGDQQGGAQQSSSKGSFQTMNDAKDAIDDVLDGLSGLKRRTRISAVTYAAKQFNAMAKQLQSAPAATTAATTAAAPAAAPAATTAATTTPKNPNLKVMPNKQGLPNPEEEARYQQRVQQAMAAQTNESLGLNYPETYEQTNDKFKSKGQRRVAALTNEEEKQRLDPKCWTGYKKQGTKMKGGTRVNNCVPVKESAILKGIKG
jgi:hypothetical protein